jgi:arginine N-succinyltransferase
VSFRVRPATGDDFPAIYEMAKLTGGGFTNLPADKPTLVDKLLRSAASFEAEAETEGGDLFVFVLENRATGDIRGTCQIFSRVGQDPDHPFYSYRIKELVQTSLELERTFRTERLTLCTDFNGCSEVGGLFLHPEARAGGLGMLLARSRYLFIRRHRARFADKVVAELRGVIEETGRSAFWDAIAGRFFGMTFAEADAFNGAHGTRFIADLMPKTPIYTAMLPQDALDVMRRPHPTGMVAMRMLEEEGFRGGDYVDIFDGGPTTYAPTAAVRSVSEARALDLNGVEDEVKGPAMLLAGGDLAGFRASRGPVRIADDGSATLDRAVAALLEIEPGDSFLAVGR